MKNHWFYPTPVIGMTLLAILVIFTNHMGVTIYGTSFGQTDVRNSTSDGYIRGNIASLQNNASDKQMWIAIGEWNSTITTQAQGNERDIQGATFSADFNMVRINGSGMHKNAISDLTVVTEESTIDNSTASLNGTVTVNTENAIIKGVPATLELSAQGSGAISILLDPSKVDEHFGNTPIYGVIWDSGNNLLR